METYREEHDVRLHKLQKAIEEFCKALLDVYQRFKECIIEHCDSIKKLIQNANSRKDNQRDSRNSWHTPFKIVPVKQVFARKPKLVHARSCC